MAPPADPVIYTLIIRASEKVYGGLVKMARRAGRTPALEAQLLFDAAYSARCRPTGDRDLDAAVAAIDQAPAPPAPVPEPEPPAPPAPVPEPDPPAPPPPAKSEQALTLADIDDAKRRHVLALSAAGQTAREIERATGVPRALVYELLLERPR